MRFKPSSPVLVPTKGDPTYRSASPQENTEPSPPPYEEPLPFVSLPTLPPDTPPAPQTDFQRIRSLLRANVAIHYIKLAPGDYVWWTKNPPNFSASFFTYAESSGTIMPHRPADLRFCLDCAVPLPKGFKDNKCRKCDPTPSKATMLRRRKTKIKRFAAAE